MPNRYLLTDYSPAEIAALPDEPLLWWLTWQAMGDEVIDCGDCQYLERYGSWHKDSTGPSGMRGDESRPSLEAILDALEKAGMVAVLGPVRHERDNDWEVEIQGFDGSWVIAQVSPSLYLAACRALLAWKRGRG